jgi:hypothetical protein
MSKFFESEIVRKEFEEIYQLQKRLQQVFISLPSLTIEEKQEFIKLMLLLVDKQEIMYFRMKLSNDPESIEMIEKIKESAFLMGLSPTMSLDELFPKMRKTLEKLEKTLDRESGM